MVEKIIVTGGSGSLGTVICKQAAEKGLRVISISASDRPKTDEPWAKDVCWVQTDIFNTNEWRDCLDGAKAVIHTIGIIREPSKEATFERINGEAAILTAKESVKARIETFIFISAAFQPPFISSRYLEAKRKAEEEISKLNIRSVFIRPSPMYGPGQRLIQPIPFLINIFAQTPILHKWLKNYGPVKEEAVARTCLKAVFDKQIKGVIGVDRIKQLGSN